MTIEALDTTHECPIEGCVKRVSDYQLMCARHWRLVSKNLAGRLYRAWSRGRGAGTSVHEEAMCLCIEEVEWKLAHEGQQEQLA